MWLVRFGNLELFLTYHQCKEYKIIVKHMRLTLLIKDSSDTSDFSLGVLVEQLDSSTLPVVGSGRSYRAESQVCLVAGIPSRYCYEFHRCLRSLGRNTCPSLALSSLSQPWHSAQLLITSFSSTLLQPQSLTTGMTRNHVALLN